MAGNRISKASGITGVGFLLVGIAAPRMIESLPAWVTPALFAGGIALLLVSAAWYFLNRKGGEDSGQSARTMGDGAPAMVAGRDLHYHPTPAPIQERKQVVSPRPPMRIHPDAVREASGHPPRRPNLKLDGVLVLVYKYLGGCPDDAAKKREFYRRVNLTIQDGFTLHGLRVWGRAFDFGASEIPQDRLEFALMDHRNHKLYIGGEWANSGIEYTDLMFNREQVELIWPLPPRTTNNGKP
jgi:hypothetical protein